MASVPWVKVFLSSTTLDLAQYREAGGALVKELNHEFEGRFHLVCSDMFNEVPVGSPLPPLQTSTGWAEQADWVVLTIGFWYGQVPEGAACSITEQEFRTVRSRGVPLFVFKAGDRGKPNAYRSLPEEIERVDLKDYVVPAADADMFQRFLDAVQAYATPLVFKNLDHYREQLKQTLRQNIMARLDASQDQGGGRNLAIEVIENTQWLRESVLPAIESAKQLSTLKDIHDRLHRIRQFGIRPWRESVLNLWPDDGAPTPMTRLAFVEPMLEVTRRLAQIETKFEALSSDWQERLGRLPAVVQHFNGGSSQLGEDRRAFSALIDWFASRQQKAFSDTNDTMQRCAEQLGRQHEHMVSRGNRVLALQGLSPDEAAALKTEIDDSVRRHTRLQAALRHHNDWQRAHDSLQCVDEAMDDGSDATDSGTMSIILAPALDDLPAIEQLVRNAPAHWGVNDAPQAIRDLHDQVLRNCGLLRQHKDSADAYRALRKSFDDLFFEVDTQTLRTVNHSRDEAVTFERRLRHTPSDGP